MSEPMSALRGAVYEWQVARDAVTAQGVFVTWKAVPAGLRPVAADYLAPHLACGPQTEAWRAALLSPESPYWVCAREVLGRRREVGVGLGRDGLVAHVGRPLDLHLRDALRAQWQGVAAQMSCYSLSQRGEAQWCLGASPEAPGVYHRRGWDALTISYDLVRLANEGHIDAQLLSDLRVANEVTAGWAALSLLEWAGPDNNVYVKGARTLGAAIEDTRRTARAQPDPTQGDLFGGAP